MSANEVFDGGSLIGFSLVRARSAKEVFNSSPLINVFINLCNNPTIEKKFSLHNTREIAA